MGDPVWMAVKLDGSGWVLKCSVQVYLVIV